MRLDGFRQNFGARVVQPLSLSSSIALVFPSKNSQSPCQKRTAYSAMVLLLRLRRQVLGVGARWRTVGGVGVSSLSSSLSKQSIDNRRWGMEGALVMGVIDDKSSC